MEKEINNEKLNDEYEKKCFELAHYIFPDVDETVMDLEVKYPVRRLKEGAIVTRIAPSPTGFMHTGSLFQAMVHRKLSMQTGGVYFLRIEDTDQKREIEGAIKKFTEELNYFGLSPDEGVISDTKEIGDYGPYVQSKRANIYRICAKHLVEKGLAYPCFCTPDMLAATHEAQERNKIIPGYYGVYAKCRNISIDESIKRVKAGEKFILRFRSNGSHFNKISFVDGARGKIEIAENEQDVVILKGDGLPTYHFAHVCDDHFMRTTHVVRGEEWIPSTPIHIQLFNAMGFDIPTYVHTPLILVKDGSSKRKLSKRKDKEAAVSYFIEAGYPKAGVLEYLMTILNSDYEMWKNKNKDKTFIDFEFKLNKMSSAGSLFDMPKLNDLCKEEIAKLDSKQVLNEVLNWSKKYSKNTYDVISKDLEYSQKVFAIERDGAKKIRKDLVKWEDVIPTFFYFFNDIYEKEIEENGYMFEYMENENAKVSKELTNKVLEEYSKLYDETLEKEAWFEQIKEIASKLGFCTDMKEYKKNPEKYIGSTADFTGILRIALTNRKNSPDIYQIMQLLGKDEVSRRLQKAICK